MDKNQIKQALSRSYGEYIKYVESLNRDEFEYAPEGKWSAGEQTIHLIKSTTPLIRALGFPKFILKSKFGKANRPSRPYIEVVNRYKEKLSVTSIENPYGPDGADPTKKEKLISQLQKNLDLMNSKLDKWSEEQLDDFVLPHPLMGKLTVREMMHFTAYHADHHRNLIKIYLKGV